MLLYPVMADAALYRDDCAMMYTISEESSTVLLYSVMAAAALHRVYYDMMYTTSPGGVLSTVAVLGYNRCCCARVRLCLPVHRISPEYSPVFLRDVCQENLSWSKGEAGWHILL